LFILLFYNIVVVVGCSVFSDLGICLMAAVVAALAAATVRGDNLGGAVVAAAGKE
jgi:hypothetical protein